MCIDANDGTDFEKDRDIKVMVSENYLQELESVAGEISGRLAKAEIRVATLEANLTNCLEDKRRYGDKIMELQDKIIDLLEGR